MKKPTFRVLCNGATKSATQQRQKPIYPFTRDQLSQSIGEPIVSVQACAEGYNLRLIASTDNLQVFMDEHDGCFYLDRIVVFKTKKFSRSKYGEYEVIRQRQHVTKEFALMWLLAAIVPPELLDLLKPLYRARGDIR